MSTQQNTPEVREKLGRLLANCELQLVLCDEIAGVVERMRGANVELRTLCKRLLRSPMVRDEDVAEVRRLTAQRMELLEGTLAVTAQGDHASQPPFGACNMPECRDGDVCGAAH